MGDTRKKAGTEPATQASERVLGRRDLVRLGLVAGAGSAGYLFSNRAFSAPGRGDVDDAEVRDCLLRGGVGQSGRGNAQSPQTTPFVEPLPIPPVKQPVASLTPAPQVDPLPGEGRTRPHQALTRFPPKKLYEIRQREARHRFHRDLPPSTVWGFDGIVPGPTFHARYGEPILVRNFNDLPQNHRGFGIPQVSTHLHNGHTPSESDGFPTDFFPFVVGGPQRFYDQHYPNVLAGFSRQYPPNGDPREAMSTLWYHDHRVDFTAPNVYKGLAGFYLLFNDKDTGDETTGFRLPSGPFDVPMMFADKLFDRDGQLFFDLFNFDGLLGDKFTVNGKIQPFFRVQPRRYRFRWLNGGPSRFYELFLTDPNDRRRAIPFTQISSDGNLLPSSITQTSVRLSVAQRADVVVDFSQFRPGTSLILENRLEQRNGRGPTGDILAAGQGDALLRFDVVQPGTPDRSLPPPYTFYEVNRPTRAELDAANVRIWEFERGNGQWQVNGEFFDGNEIRASIPEGASEIWVLRNRSGGWQHPIHIHFEELQILSRNGAPPPPNERGRNDVVRLGFNEEVRVFVRFRDFVGRYPMHCHNTIHEDHAMMIRFDVVRA
ncbi:MAG: multicopper oxidase domain-containing protein [Labilithrix sp.]|nr:multicopper oxidase domain-containing protein [Labilithrix sp.]